MRNSLKMVRALLVLCIGTIMGSCGEIPEVEVKLDWPSFLSDHDLVWEQLPEAYTEGAFMGNGMLGNMLYKVPGKNAIRMEICRSDVQDHRGDDQGETPYSRGRLPIGHFLLVPKGEIEEASMRLDLWNAETSAKIRTSAGEILLRSYVHAESMLVVTEVNATEGENGFEWKWEGEKAISPRQLWGIDKDQPFRVFEGYKENPPFELGETEGISYCLQPLLESGQTVTAWKEIDTGKGRTLVVNVSHSWPDNKAKDLAVATVAQTRAKHFSELERSHRQWWHNYYPQSFVSIPDNKFESFYWIQMYKLASATRKDRAYIDNHGPWLEKTAWPYATWNLNVQLTYWPVYTSNRLPLGESLLNALWDNRENLRNNLPEVYRKESYGIGRAAGTDCIASVGIPGVDSGDWILDQANTPEIGLLPWACHNLWLQYRYSMDESLLREKVFPLLRGAINYYLYFLKGGPDGKLHLPKTYSPEYGQSYDDCNFDLALIRWGCETLLESAEILQISDPLAPKWKDVLENLVDFPENEEGFMIGKDQAYDRSHRHFSHLLMVYPLHLVHIDQPNGRERIQRSLNHWQSKKEYLMGYSYTGASSMAATLGEGNLALDYLKGLWGEFLRPNTLYVEDGPCIETPLSGAQSIHDMLLQSWGNKIRVFPAMPDVWADASFADLRTEGAFLVSAKREKGKTDFVKIKSLAGAPLIIAPGIKGKILTSGKRKFKMENIGEGLFSIDLKKNEEVILHTDQTKHFVLKPVSEKRRVGNYYGSKAMKKKKEYKGLE
ncbi:glycosyl hydrolase family 95 catalytic domain-containing protein [Zobellia galactanivorans]|uniref:Alpha-L-fucosidase, family GH95 n=1 Tax=Zobellia galactanivorans (strain DSM 12802 / CCUG 47099 / CIP 106680 / NCIMB 13871 / Dsij) TaxID=63186 RepID=G0L947_ZOBGA|nr:alpha-L-fucosidase [Zobellia galactanivorans]CAZ94336.1 Alpha-L-fucosidase, family GH95 [Zobellia galactanivorans]